MGDEQPKAGTVFISYTHDTPEHENCVWELSERLRNDGIDCRVDQQEESPAEGWPRWCRNRIDDARLVLVVCTETYRRRYEGKDKTEKGLGGKWEGFVITQELYDDQAANVKFVPVIFATNEAQYIPLELHGATHYDLSARDGYELLLRRISAQPKRKASPVAGRVPDLPPVSVLPTLARKTQPSTSIFTVPLPENPFFTERGTELSDLKAALEKTGGYALTGLGGVGKTQTAAEYAHRQRDAYEAVIWLRAEKEETLFADLTALAGLLKLPEAKAQEQQVAADAAQLWLDETDGWLLVLDNVTDLKTVASLTRKARPQRRHVIVTQQAQATGTIAAKKHLPSMSELTGALLVLRRAQRIDPDADLSAADGYDAAAAREISQEVGGLPLALDQAGAYISQTGCGVREYLNLLRSSMSELLDRRGELDFEHRSVMATYSASLLELATQNEAAAELLNAAAFPAPDAIPEEIFTEGAADFPEALQQAAANRLK